MNKISKILLILTLVHSLCIDVYAQQSALKPVLNERTNLYGFKDANDNLIVDYIYEEYDDMGEVICVVRQSKVGFINNQGVEVIPCKYGYGNMSFISRKLIFLNKDGLFGLVDFNGNVILPFIYEEGKQEKIKDLFSVKKNGKYGFISLKEQKEVIPTIYDDIKTAEQIYNNGIIAIDNPCQSMIISARKNGKWGAIDLSGRTVIPFIYDHDPKYYRTNLFINGVSIVKKDDKFGLIDESGKMVIPTKYKSIFIDLNNLDDKLYYVKDFSGRETLFSHEGKQLCGYYEDITETGDYKAIFKENGKSGLINLERNKEIISAKYDDIDNINENFARVKLNNLYGYVNATTGEETFKCEFQDGGAFVNGFCRIKKNDKWGYIKAYGYSGIYISCEYDDCRNFRYDNLAVVEKDGRLGCINTKGKLVIPCIYKSLDNYGQVSSVKNTNSPERLYRLANPLGAGANEGWGYLDSDGNEIVECKYTMQIAKDMLYAYWEKNAVSDVDENIYITSSTNKETFVIIIANQDYHELSSVDFAINDGKIFKEYCNKTLGIPEQNIKYKENATLNNIRSQINWVKDITRAHNGNAKVIFYYAGHGIPDETNNSSYLLPIDGIGNDPRSAYSLNELYAQLGELSAKQITVFMDACFSGAKRDGGMLTSARSIAIKAKSGTPKGNMIVFSAAQGDETAHQYNKKKHGMFTYFLLKKLQETKGEASLEELATYIKEQVEKCSIIENGKLQTPTIQLSPEFKNSIKDITL